MSLKPGPLQISSKTRTSSFLQRGATCRIILLGNWPLLFARVCSFPFQILPFSHSFRQKIFQGKKIQVAAVQPETPLFLNYLNVQSFLPHFVWVSF